MKLEIPSPHGKKVWQTSTVESILANEKYKGDALLQKTFTADELSGFLFELGELDLLDTEWKDSLFRTTVERITVHNDGRLVFTFRNGSEETVMM